MRGGDTKDKSIRRSQYMDLDYSQSSTLYDLISNAPHPSNDPSRPALKSHDDGMVGSITTRSTTSSTSKQAH